MHQTQENAFNTLAGGESTSVPACEVIVAVEPPLLRDMLTRLIGRIGGLHVRAGLAGWSGLAPLLEEADVQWVIVTLGPDHKIPEMVEALLDRHPSICVLGIAADGSKVQLGCTGVTFTFPPDLSLEELLSVIVGESDPVLPCKGALKDAQPSTQQTIPQKRASIRMR